MQPNAAYKPLVMAWVDRVPPRIMQLCLYRILNFHLWPFKAGSWSTKKVQATPTYRWLSSPVNG